MEYKDYYQIMGLSKSVSQADIKKTYRKLARKYHPDVNKESDAEERFKELGEAYEVLKDPEKRMAYDQLGANWKAGQEGFKPPPDWDAGYEFHGSNGADGEAFSDFFEELFRKGGGAHYSSAQGGSDFHARGGDSHAKVFIDIEDAYQGASRSLSLRTTIMGDDGRPQLKDRTLNVKIPKGVKEGQSIRLQGQGGPGMGQGSAGDLYLEICFNQHSIYKVKGLDVLLELPIAPWEAALGTKITIPTPAGVSSGKKMRLKGRGIPAKTAGDFYVVLDIVLPDTLSEQEKTLYESLKSASVHFNPRKSLEV